MKLYLQFGYGMMAHVKHMFKEWKEGTVILSPRDMSEDQISKFSKDLKSTNAKTLLDPQLYVPRSDHHGLLKHDYYNDFGGDNYSTSIISDDNSMSELFEELKRLNDLGDTDKYIIPGLLCEDPNESWNMLQKSFLRMAKKHFTDKKMIATLCLSSKILNSTKIDKIEQVMAYISKYNVDGFYILAEGNYLETNPIWLGNLLSLTAAIKMLDKEVIVGYANHQMMALACSGTDAIATGNWLNVRHFNLKRFIEPISTGGRKVAWYYCPCTQSEYRYSTLEATKRLEKLDIELLRPDKSLNSNYLDSYFDNDVEFKEPASFRHYFQCLYKQIEIISKNTFEDTLNTVINMQDNAEKMIEEFSNKELRERDRSYSNVGDATITALKIFDKEKGILMKRLWKNF
ncbi:MAG: hypothetical protein ACNI25_13935 [Halarcobacter sp.]